MILKIVKGLSVLLMGGLALYGAQDREVVIQIIVILVAFVWHLQFRVLNLEDRVRALEKQNPAKQQEIGMSR